MASDENVGRARTLGRRCPCSSSVASGRPTSTRFRSDTAGGYAAPSGGTRTAAAEFLSVRRMRRLGVLVTVAAAISPVVVATQGAAPARGTTNPIDHVVVLMHE